VVSQRQLKPMQCEPEGHLKPHAPQLLSSPVSVFVHTPLQHASPKAAQSRAVWQPQKPTTHFGLLSGHLFPQKPQLLGSVAVSTHCPLQSSLVSGQAHCPMTHSLPPVQTLPHAPQLLGSLAVSTHVPLHEVCPVGQPTTHWLSSHFWPGAQAWPQLPQFAASVRRSVQTPTVPKGTLQQVSLERKHPDAQAPKIQVSHLPESQRETQAPLEHCSQKSELHRDTQVALEHCWHWAESHLDTQCPDPLQISHLALSQID
jgi:hypothetical protein